MSRWSFTKRGDCIYYALREVFDRCFEHPEIVVPGHVAVQPAADPFSMSHLAEDTAVRRRDALDGKEGIVGIKVYIRSSLIVKIYILRGDLPVCTSEVA